MSQEVKIECLYCGNIFLKVIWSPSDMNYLRCGRCGETKMLRARKEEAKISKEDYYGPERKKTAPPKSASGAPASTPERDRLDFDNFGIDEDFIRRNSGGD